MKKSEESEKSEKKVKKSEGEKGGDLKWRKQNLENCPRPVVTLNV